MSAATETTQTTENNGAETQTPTETPTPPKSYNVVMRPKELLEWLVRCPDIMTDDFYAESIEDVYNSKLFSDSETFPLLLSAIKGKHSARVQRIMDLGQGVFERESTLLTFNSCHILSQVLTEDIAVILIRTVPAEALNKAILANNCRAGAFMELGRTENPEYFEVAKSFFMGLSTMPHSASPKLLLECGIAGVFHSDSAFLIKGLVPIFSALRNELDSKTTELSAYKDLSKISDTQILEANKQVLLLRQEVSKLQSSLDLANQVVSEREVAVRDCQMQLENASSAIGLLRQEVSDLKSSGSTFEEKFKASEQKLEDANQTISFLQARNSLYFHGREEATSELSAQKKLTDQYKVQNLHLETAKETLTTKNEKLQEELNSKEKMLSEIQDALKQILEPAEKTEKADPSDTTEKSDTN